MTEEINAILMKLNEYGNFRSSTITNRSGEVLGSFSDEKNKELIKIIASKLTQFAFDMEDLENLSEFLSSKLKFKEEYVIVRKLKFPRDKETYLLIILSELPESKDIDTYHEQILEWAVKALRPEFKKRISA
ncbi:MAG: hypothetical protein ACTSR8_07750 [Promethearchaeota archaeon]